MRRVIEEKERNCCKYAKIISNFTHNYSSATNSLYNTPPACSNNRFLSSCFIISCNIEIPLSVSLHFCITPHTLILLFFDFASLSIDFHSLQTGPGSIIAQCTLAKSFISCAPQRCNYSCSMLLLLVIQPFNEQEKNPLLVDIWHLIKSNTNTGMLFSSIVSPSCILVWLQLFIVEIEISSQKFPKASEVTKTDCPTHSSLLWMSE